MWVLSLPCTNVCASLSKWLVNKMYSILSYVPTVVWVVLNSLNVKKREKFHLFLEVVFFSYHLSMVGLRPSSSLSTDCVVSFRGDWAIFCHAVSGRVGRVWSAREKSLAIVRRGWELNPGFREDRQWAIPLSCHDWSLGCIYILFIVSWISHLIQFKLVLKVFFYGKEVGQIDLWEDQDHFIDRPNMIWSRVGRRTHYKISSRCSPFYSDPRSFLCWSWQPASWWQPHYHRCRWAAIKRGVMMLICPYSVAASARVDNSVIYLPEPRERKSDWHPCSFYIEIREERVLPIYT